MSDQAPAPAPWPGASAAPLATPATERFLADFHDRQPGLTPQAFGGLAVTGNDGRAHASSYHALADALGHALAKPLAPAAARGDAAGGAWPALPTGAAPTRPTTRPVLDLACGDGHLLALVAPCLPPDCPLLGVDFSAGELAAASARLGALTQPGQARPGHTPVQLHQARAQALPLADASLAAITCHMALMLMAEPEAVVAELQRVLRPGGVLLALLPAVPAAPGPAGLDDLTAAFVAALGGQARQTDWQAVRFASRRWCEPTALAQLLGPDLPVAHSARLHGAERLTPAQAWAYFTTGYDLHLLPAAAWPEVEVDFTARCGALADRQGRVLRQQDFWLVQAERR